MTKEKSVSGEIVVESLKLRIKSTVIDLSITEATKLMDALREALGRTKDSDPVIVKKCVDRYVPNPWREVPSNPWRGVPSGALWMNVTGANPIAPSTLCSVADEPSFQLCAVRRSG